MMVRENYSRRATLDVRDACAMALQRVLEAIDVVLDGERVTFTAVYDQWPTADDQYVPPVACVLPPDNWKYDDGLFTPTCLEDTWEHDATTGWALYKTAEMIDTFTVGLRTTSSAMRSLLKLALENSFQASGVLMDQSKGPHYGIVVDLPEYWGLKAQAWLIDGSNSDNEDSAMRNQREATFSVRMQCSKVQLGPCNPATMTITKTFPT